MASVSLIMDLIEIQPVTFDVPKGREIDMIDSTLSLSEGMPYSIPSIIVTQILPVSEYRADRIYFSIRIRVRCGTISEDSRKRKLLPERVLTHFT